MKLACAKRGLVRTGQHLGARAWCARRVNYSQASSAPTTPAASTAPAPEATHQPHHQHQKPRANQTSSPATSHTNPHQPHHQHQKPRANQASSPGNTTHQPAATAAPTPKATRQSSQQPRQHHTPTRSNQQQPQHQRQEPAPEATRRPHQRFLYCDGETPNISLKYFAKYFCVPKPTASETSTTLSPASADNSWAALLSRMVRMNTEGFIP